MYAKRIDILNKADGDHIASVSYTHLHAEEAILSGRRLRVPDMEAGKKRKHWKRFSSARMEKLSGNYRILQERLLHR